MLAALSWSLLAAPAEAAPTAAEAAQAAYRLLDEIEATPAQRAQLEQIASATLRELDTSALPAAARLARELGAALTSDKIDTAAVEAARRGAVELFDRTSADLLPRALEAASVLTPAQRKALAARIEGEVAQRISTSGS